MRIYFDPSLIIALYLPEKRTPSLRAWLASQRCRIELNAWQELEFKNGSALQTASRFLIRGGAGIFCGA
jgi:hypothetical protein